MSLNPSDKLLFDRISKELAKALMDQGVRQINYDDDAVYFYKDGKEYAIHLSVKESKPTRERIKGKQAAQTLKKNKR